MWCSRVSKNLFLKGSEDPSVPPRSNLIAAATHATPTQLETMYTSLRRAGLAANLRRARHLARNGSPCATTWLRSVGRVVLQNRRLVCQRQPWLPGHIKRPHHILAGAAHRCRSSRRGSAHIEVWCHSVDAPNISSQHSTIITAREPRLFRKSAAVLEI
jgi:hypothetical protein